MKKFILASLLLVASSLFGQTTTPSAFSTTTFNFNLSPISLPGSGQSVSGAETDVLAKLTTNNAAGETTLISSSPFIGGRYEHYFPSVAKFLQNHTSLAGANFEAGLTASAGVVSANKKYWGERAGLTLKYAPAGSTTFTVGADLEWNNLPGVAHNAFSVAVGPQFRF